MAPDETDALLIRSKQLLDEFNIEDHPLTKFTTSEKEHVGDEYFLTSGDKIRYFLDEDALDKEGKLTREKQKAVNKIGHGELHYCSSVLGLIILFTSALHELDPVFRKVTLENEKLRALVRDLKFHTNPVGVYEFASPCVHLIPHSTSVDGHNQANSYWR